MLPLKRDARRLLIRTSGKLELWLIEMGEELAQREGARAISPEHINLAIRAVAGDNAVLLEKLAEETVCHAGRRAG